jgi:hypothetical protein
MKTANIKRLMEDVLSSLPRPYTEHVIEEVFVAIEYSPKLRKNYDDLCDEFGKTVTNSLGGYWIGRALGKVGERQVTSHKTTLLGSYSILDSDAPPPPARKPNQSEAASLMSEYYQSHKTETPPTIRKHRELIIQLLMDGMSPAEAFAAALDGGT